jgi:predicted dehydrogenase
VRVGVLGAGAWAELAHLPGWARDARCELVAIADPVRERAQVLAERFGIPHVYDAPEPLIARDDLAVVDVCTPSATHLALATAALEAGKHVLCEKPVAYDFRDTRRAASWRAPAGLKTKLGFTFRYSPAMRYMQALIAEGLRGDALHLQRLRAELAVARPATPLRQVDHEADQSESRSPRSRDTARPSWTSRTSSWGAASRRSSAR